LIQATCVQNLMTLALALTEISRDSYELTTPLSGMTKLSSIVEPIEDLLWSTYVPNLKSYSYKDMKGDAQCRKLGGLGSKGSLKVIRNSIIRWS